MLFCMTSFDSLFGLTYLHAGELDLFFGLLDYHFIFINLVKLDPLWEGVKLLG
jgi:hypothetical protein